MSVIRLHDSDNVAIATTAVKAGDLLLAGCSAVARMPIPAMHKVALAAIAKGAFVRRYNQVIGVASQDIAAGDHVHSHNCDSLHLSGQTADASLPTAPAPLIEKDGRHFMGYHRASGKVGTRNYIGIIPTVNCAATVAKHIARVFESPGALADYPNVDGIVAFVHSGGCSMRQGGDDYLNLHRVLTGFIRHPNFGGLLLVGLGCEVMQLDHLLNNGKLQSSDTFKHLVIQETGGTAKSIAEGVAAVRAMLPTVNTARRQPAPVGDITIALQCGGSDALSGVTANPALGVAADLLVACGGTAILSETPEIYGAEHLLMARAATPQIAKALLQKIHWWEEHVTKFNEKIENNPSPGNKAGGLTTIQEKSLGAMSKGGSSRLMKVYDYAAPITEKGLVFMDSPGFDPASVTGQVASGATIVCFTTGRGSAFGFKPAPTLKLASNSALYERQRDDMDINCGRIADGAQSVEGAGREIFEEIITVASGQQTKSEILGYGDNELVPWRTGPVL